MIGKTISRYKILEKVGEGAMGVVYKAEDIRLNRLTAVKFLRSEFTADEEAKDRFIREARAASSLDHPNICTVHEIDETEDGRLFIAMAYYDGETLKEIIKNTSPEPYLNSGGEIPPDKGGPAGTVARLPIPETIGIAIQIALGLEAAHEAGIVHRDVKPSNILVTKKGDVKILDFGLAKLAGDMSRTVTGSTLGTVEYMSPEQAQGFEVDPRSDVWSLGVLMYEMIVGRPPFRGDRPLAVIHSILHDRPESIADLCPEISMDFESVVSCALSKKAEDRYPSMRHMAEDLTTLEKDVGQKTAERFPLHSETYKKRRLKRTIKKMIIISFLTVLSLVFLTAGIHWLLPIIHKPLPPGRMIPFTDLEGSEVDPAFSPAGNMIAFEWTQSDSNRTDIYVKAIGGDQATRLTFPPGSYCCPIWSPNGREIAFFRYDKGQWTLNSMSAMGDKVRLFVKLSSQWQFWTNRAPFENWSPDGHSLVYPDFAAGENYPSLFLLSLQTLKTHRITSPPRETLGDWSPKFSFDGKAIAFLRQKSLGTGDIFVVPAEGGKDRRITFDDGIINSLAWTADGKEIIYSANAQLCRVSIHGDKLKPVMPGIRNAGNLTISKDGRKLAFDEWSSTRKIWRYDIPGSRKQDISSHPILMLSRNNGHAHFSPDGSKIAFFSDREGYGELWVSGSDGTHPVRLTNLGNVVSGTPRWSPDGKWIAFDSRPEGHSDIFVVNAEGGPLKRVTDSPSDDRIPSWSRDGKWIYFTSNRSGSFQVWKTSIQGGQALLITKDGGVNGFESYDGKWFYYNEKLPPNGIWKLSLVSGEKRLVTNIDIGLFNWFVVKDGIYFVKRPQDIPPSLEFLNLRTGKIKYIAELNQKNLWSLSVSPDNQSFLVSDSQVSADIILVENFHVK